MIRRILELFFRQSFQLVDRPPARDDFQRLLLQLVNPSRVPIPPAPLVEISRTNLVCWQKLWCLVGHTNPVTGILLET